MHSPALRAAAASAAALGAIALAAPVRAQVAPPTATVPACHTFDALGQPATLFSPGDKIVVKGEGFGLVTTIGITFVEQSKTTILSQAYSSELGVFSTDRANPVIPSTATPGPASIHAFSNTRVATCAVQVMAAAAAAAPKKKTGSSKFVVLWGALLAAFGVFLAVVGLRRWRAGRLQTAVGQAPAGPARPDDDFELPILETLEVRPPDPEPATADSPAPAESPQHPDESPQHPDDAQHAARSLAELAAPPLPEPVSPPARSPRTLADLAAPPPPEPTEQDSRSPRTLADLAAPPLPEPKPEPEARLEEPPASEWESARLWPAHPPVEPSGEILTPRVYWPTEDLADAEEDYSGERDFAPEHAAPTVRPSPIEVARPVDFADASAVADALEVPMPHADHEHPPILDATPGGDWPTWNGRGPHEDAPADIDDGEQDPVVVDGDMSDTVARLVEDMKGWSKE